jgi:hypothetical protein
VPYVPGNAIEGYCAGCKADTVQTVLVVEGFQIRSVRCEKCGVEGPMQRSRSKTKAGIREVLAKRQSVLPPPPHPKRRSRKEQIDPAQVFRRLLEGRELSLAEPYNIHAALELGQVIRHPTFGIGIVTTLCEDSKVNVTFEQGVKTIAHNRK